MRLSKIRFFVAISSALILAGPAISADQCTTSDGEFTITAADPELVACTNPVSGGATTCTRFGYDMVSQGANASHVVLVFDQFFAATQETINLFEADPAPNSPFLAPTGDNTTGAAEDFGTKQGVRFNPKSDTLSFSVDVEGRLTPVPADVFVVGGGKNAKLTSCLIDGPGRIPRDPNQPTNTFQTINLKGCEATVELNATTGEFIRTVETNFGSPECPLGNVAIEGAALNTLTIIDGEGNSLGSLELADEGFLGTTGEGSCTSFNFGGIVYSYCTCIPVDTNGDGILEQRDPVPTCPCGTAATGVCPGDANFPN
jgi:hypothetical protein